ncbi:hypothetical protein F4806DRAFT_501823 [Annulohypoxylon nitens]|nr:hypothetical protein F4806DRAFT_501823 [Annulohypoxylon nitens]
MDQNNDSSLTPPSSAHHSDLASLAQVPHPSFASSMDEASTTADASASIFKSPQAIDKTPSHLESMMAARTGSFQSFIKNIQDWHKVHKVYLRINDTAEYDHHEFPSDEKKQRELVKALFEAAQDCSKIVEPRESRAAKHIQQKRYTDLEFELVLWPLLMSIHNAQAGKCNIPNYSSLRDSRFKTYGYNTYSSFKERFDAVHDALLSSKDIVASIFTDNTFLHRLAWRPKWELSRKVANNRKLHMKQETRMSANSQVAHQNKMKATLDGGLIGQDNQPYANVEKRTAVLEDRTEEAKKVKTYQSEHDTKQMESPSDVLSPQHTTFADAGFLGNPEEILQQSHDLPAAYTFQEPLTSSQSPPQTNTDEPVFTETGAGLAGMHSESFMGYEGPEPWFDLMLDDDALDALLNGEVVGEDTSNVTE